MNMVSMWEKAKTAKKENVSVCYSDRHIVHFRKL